MFPGRRSPRTPQRFPIQSNRPSHFAAARTEYTTLHTYTDYLGDTAIETGRETGERPPHGPEARPGPYVQYTRQNRRLTRKADH